MISVMIFDDEPIIRKGLVSLIEWEKLKCEVIYTGGNGEEAKENIDKLMPNIIITDVKMPGMNGIELAEYVYNNYPKTKVIILTAYANLSYAKNAIEYGVLDFIEKTDPIEKIEKAVIKAVKIINYESYYIVNKDIHLEKNNEPDKLLNSEKNNNDKYDNSIVEKAVIYIYENYNKNITLGDIASNLHVNSSYLSRLFSVNTGTTIVDTINTIRINKAKGLLTTTNMKIYEIALAVGIEETTYFSYVFKKYVGHSPKEYKKLDKKL